MNRLNVCMGALVVWSCTALAQSPATTGAGLEPVGRVKTLSGKATVNTQSQMVSAVLGTPVFQGSVIQTEKNATLGLTFKDGTVLSLGAETRVTVDEYLYDPNQGQYKFAANLGKGALNYLSGAIAKTRPDAVTVKTPTAVIGVRGTHFVVSAEDVQ
jgi:hypothetical protein